MGRVNLTLLRSLYHAKGKCFLNNVFDDVNLEKSF